MATMSRILSCLLLLLTYLPCAAVESIFFESGGLYQQQGNDDQKKFEYDLPQDFYVGKCDPCIPRATYRIRVILHGTVSDVYWQHVVMAMEQASRDTGVFLDVASLHPDGSSLMEIYSTMAYQVRQLFVPDKRRADALIVTLPSPLLRQVVEQALQQYHLPVFGFHSGYEVSEQLGLLGFVAQDEELAGRKIAQELLTAFQPPPPPISDFAISNISFSNETAIPVESKHVLFINHQVNEVKMAARFRGLRMELLEGSDGNILTTQLTVDPAEVFEMVQTLNDQAFQDCPYDAVVLGGEELVDIAVSALEDSGCSAETMLISFGMSEEIVRAIVNGQIAFSAAPQYYMESVFAVVMASLFVTTGKKLSLPQDSNVYLSGPVIRTIDNLSTDSIDTCREQAFPVCNADFEPYGPMITTNYNNPVPCNHPIGCLSRQSIRIGGVLHGVSTDVFWDPVFAAAYQAAADVGITLELERLERQETNEIIMLKMAARIQSLCESGVDGIFVTIPGDGVLDAIRVCQSLQVPVVSVNAGADFSEQLGLMQHVGQMEYNAGYGAGQRLGNEDIKEAYCLNHQVGNVVLDDRCRGFSDALAAEHPDIIYRGMIATSDDHEALHHQAVEGGVAEMSPDAVPSWEGIGFILGGAGQVESMMKLVELHPKAVVGTFDLAENMFEPFEDGRLKFGIDQQPFLQGVVPVYLLTYAAYTQQALINDVIETGPRFVDSRPLPDEGKCEATFFAICSILPDEDMKLIHPVLLIVGYCMVALTVVSALICIVFVLYYRNRSVLVRISQPPFLIALCIGIIVSVSSIIPMGVQTDYRFEKDHVSTGELTDVENSDVGGVDAACMMVPWLYSLGFVMVFSSLFGKIWRVQLIFRAGESFRRRKVTFMDIAPYTAIMFAIVTSLLIVWQIAAPFRWERDVVVSDSDGFALESTGKCTSEHGWYYWLVILCFQVFCLLYALVLCFQTKHIEDDLSESSNTFLSVICIFQINVLAMPIAAMVRDDTQVFLQNYTVLCLMFVPKVYRIMTDNDVTDLSRRRSSRTPRSSIRVSFADSARYEGSSAFQPPPGPGCMKRPSLPAATVDPVPDNRGRESKESVVSFAEDYQEAKETAPKPQDGSVCPTCFRLQKALENRDSVESSRKTDDEIATIATGSTVNIATGDGHGCSGDEDEEIGSSNSAVEALAGHGPTLLAEVPDAADELASCPSDDGNTSQ